MLVVIWQYKFLWFSTLIVALVRGITECNLSLRARLNRMILSSIIVYTFEYLLSAFRWFLVAGLLNMLVWWFSLSHVSNKRIIHHSLVIREHVLSCLCEENHLFNYCRESCNFHILFALWFVVKIKWQFVWISFLEQLCHVYMLCALNLFSSVREIEASFVLLHLIFVSLLWFYINIQIVIMRILHHQSCRIRAQLKIYTFFE